MQEIIITQKAGEIGADFEGMKEYLNSQLEQYRGIIFTEESKKDAKGIVADLRKGKKAFSDRVRDAKAEYMKPFDDFNAKAQELIKLFDEPIDFINAQVTEFENARIEEKKQIIATIYIDIMPKNLMEILPLDKIYNAKWENATFTKKQIIDEITERCNKASADLEAIKSMGSDAEQMAIDLYKNTFDLSECMKAVAQYEKQKQDILAKQKEDELRAKIELEKKHEQDMEEAKAEAVDMLIQEDNGEDTHLYTYAIHLTQSAKEKLEMYMDSVGIEYGEMFI